MILSLKAQGKVYRRRHIVLFFVCLFWLFGECSSGCLVRIVEVSELVFFEK